jgi:lipopolysaccharide assembly outer membrane protein LptD (OstA)
LKKLTPLLGALLLLVATACLGQTPTGPGWDVFGTGPQSEFETINGTNYFWHGGAVSNLTAVVSGDDGVANELTGNVNVEGDVTILDRGHIWRGTNFIYNFKTGQVRAGAFKTVQEPFSVAGRNLTGRTNESYTSTNAIISTDDFARPAYTIHARRIVITPGEQIQAYHAWLYLGSYPVFYWPYLSHSLKANHNNFEFTPGDRGIYGPYLLSAYNWYGYSNIDGTIHLDLRERRGVAGGPDLLFHMGNWGEAAMRYYYADDLDPSADGITAPFVKRQRQRAAFVYDVTPWTNATIKAVANYQSDPLIIRDFYEGEYNANVQPRTFVEGTQLGNNYVADVMAEPRLVDFFETVERLPDIRLEGLRQQVGASPFYYENESSVGYYTRAFSDTNLVMPPPLPLFWIGPAPFGPYSTPSYSAARLDTLHQLTLPETFFGWLNVNPRLAGRLTYYSDVTGPNIHTNQQVRAAMETGVDVNFKIWREYDGAESSLLDINGLRHFIQPEFDYGYAPAPTRSASQIPQFDYQAPSLRLLPMEFPEYNSVDALGSQNVLRLVLNNRFQTKRKEGTEDVFDWSIYTDWNLSRGPGTNAPFENLYNDVAFRPRSWLTFSSSTRYDLENPQWREALQRVTIQPSTVWSLSLGYYYLMNNDPEFQTYANENIPGHSLIDLSFYYRLNENWGFHMYDLYEAQDGVFQQQVYTIYRDLRSWTAALNFMLTQGPGQPDDFTVALTFSLKAFPRLSGRSESQQPLDRFASSSVVDPMMEQ